MIEPEFPYDPEFWKWSTIILTVIWLIISRKEIIGYIKNIWKK